MEWSVSKPHRKLNSKDVGSNKTAQHSLRNAPTKSALASSSNHYEGVTRQRHGPVLQPSSNMRISRLTGMNGWCDLSTAGHILQQLAPPAADQVGKARPWHQSCLPRTPNRAEEVHRLRGVHFRRQYNR